MTSAAIATVDDDRERHDAYTTSLLPSFTVGFTTSSNISSCHVLASCARHRTFEDAGDYSYTKKTGVNKLVLQLDTARVKTGPKTRAVSPQSTVDPPARPSRCPPRHHVWPQWKTPPIHERFLLAKPAHLTPTRQSQHKSAVCGKSAAGWNATGRPRFFRAATSPPTLIRIP